jgi:uncharacterized protein YdeI (YjbR/CyaY-like superfamily)
MAAELGVLDVRSSRQWRTWLREHHAASPGVWLVFHKHHTGVKSLLYEEAVRQALCTRIEASRLLIYSAAARKASRARCLSVTRLYNLSSCVSSHARVAR